MKRCTKCHKERDEKEFRMGRNGAGKFYVEGRCKHCERSRAMQYYRSLDKAKAVANARKNKLKMMYGISVEQYEELLARQDNKCAICLSDDPKGRGKFHVDHDHKTGKVRGLLCHYCNLALGNFKDSIETLIKAKEYLLASR